MHPLVCDRHLSSIALRQMSCAYLHIAVSHRVIFDLPVGCLHMRVITPDVEHHWVAFATFVLQVDCTFVWGATVFRCLYTNPLYIPGVVCVCVQRCWQSRPDSVARCITLILIIQ